MMPHIPVLLNEAIEYLSIKPGGLYLDCTFGAGGYSRAMLSVDDQARVIAIDRDPSVKEMADSLSAEYPDRFRFVNAKFSELNAFLTAERLQLDGVVFDFGVSSMQIDNDSRGFSFMRKAPLDMRMGRNNFSAYEIVNKASRAELEHILLKYGEEYKFRQISEKIIEFRQKRPIKTTTELADIIKRVYRSRTKIHPATKTFQAIRICVNDELNEISAGLSAARDCLEKRARIVAVTFHSLEDRIIKNYFRNCNKSEFRVLTKKPEIAKEEELKLNPRARSAKLRAMERIGLL